MIMDNTLTHSDTRESSKDKQISPEHQQLGSKPNQVGTVVLYGVPIVSLVIENSERLCLAQISNTLLKEFSYNEIHNRRVALGITCVQCTPVQLEILRRAGAMPVSSRRCGMITRREAERLCKSFLGDNSPPRLPEDFAFPVHHECAWGCRGAFLPARYNSSRAKCIKCSYCGLFFSPNKFIFHSHRTGPNSKYIQPDAANFNSWRRHMKLSGTPPDQITHAWEDVKAMFNGGTRKRLLASSSSSHHSHNRNQSPTGLPSPPKLLKVTQEATSTTGGSNSAQLSLPGSATALPPSTPRVPPFPDLSLPLSRSFVMDYVWQHSTTGIKHQFPFPTYAALPWLAAGGAKRVPPFLSFGTHTPDLPLHAPPSVGHLHPSPIDGKLYPSAFRPVCPIVIRPEPEIRQDIEADGSDEETVDIETTEDDTPVVSSIATPPTTGNLQVTVQSCWEEEKKPVKEPEVVSPPEGSPQKEDNPVLKRDEEPVARLYLERVLHRQEMARHLHIMRELGVPSGAEPASYFSLPEVIQDAERRHGRMKDTTALDQLSTKMALDCSACHHLYSASSMQPPETKVVP